MMQDAAAGTYAGTNHDHARSLNFIERSRVVRGWAKLDRFKIVSQVSRLLHCKSLFIKQFRMLLIKIGNLDHDGAIGENGGLGQLVPVKSAAQKIEQKLCSTEGERGSEIRI